MNDAAMTIQLAAGVCSALGLLGTILNLRAKRACFHVWLFSNLGFVGLYGWLGVYPSAGLHVVYAWLAVCGIRSKRWRVIVVEQLPNGCRTVSERSPNGQTKKRTD